MSKKWCEQNQATVPVDRREGIENAASFPSGTGPYRLRERRPVSVPPLCAVGELHWGKIDGNVDEIDLHPRSAWMEPAWRHCCPAK